MNIKERKVKCSKNTAQIQQLKQKLEEFLINQDNPSKKLVIHPKQQMLRGGGCGSSIELASQPLNLPSYIPVNFSSNIKKYSDIIVEKASIIFDKMKKNEVLIALLWFQDNAIYIQSLCLNDQMTLKHYPLIEKTLENLMKCLDIYLQSSGYLFYQLLQICNCLIRVIFSYQLKNEDRFLQENLKQVFLEQIANIETLMQIESTNIWITGIEFEIQLIKTWLSHCRTNSEKPKELGLAVLSGIVSSIAQLKPSDELIQSLIESAKFILMNFFECQIKNPIQKYEIYYFFESLKWSILNQLLKGCSVQKQIKQIEEGYKKYIEPSKDWMIHFCWINVISDLISYRPIINKKSIPNIIKSTQPDYEIFKQLLNSQHIVSIPYDKNYARVQIFNVEKSNYQIFKELKIFQEYLISEEVHQLNLWHKYINFDINNKQNYNISKYDLNLQLLRSQTNCDEIFKLNTLLQHLRDEIFKLIDEVIQQKISLFNIKKDQNIQLNIQKQDLKCELKQLKQNTLQFIYICNEIDIKLNQEKVKISLIMETLKSNEEACLLQSQLQYNLFVASFDKINQSFQQLKFSQLFDIWFFLLKFIHLNYDVLKPEDQKELEEGNSYYQDKFKSTVTEITIQVNTLINLIKELQSNFTSILCQKSFQLVIKEKISIKMLSGKLKEIYQLSFFKQMIVQSKQFIQQNFSIKKCKLQSKNYQQYLYESRSLIVIIFTIYRLLQINSIKLKIVQEKLTKLLSQTEENNSNSKSKKIFKDQILKKIQSQIAKLELIKSKSNQGETQEYTNVIQSILQDIEWISKSDFDQLFKNNFIISFQEVFNKIQMILFVPNNKNEILQEVLDSYEQKKNEILKNEDPEPKMQGEKQSTNNSNKNENYFSQEPELIKSLSNILQKTKKIRFVLKSNLNILQMMQNDQNKEQFQNKNTQDTSNIEPMLKNLQEQIQKTQDQLENINQNIFDQEEQSTLNQLQQCDLYQFYLILFDSNINQSNVMNNQFEEIKLDENLNFMFQQQNQESFQQQKLRILTLFDNNSHKVRELLAFNLIKAQYVIQEGTIQDICSNLLKQIWIIEQNLSVRKVLQNQEMIEMQKQLFSKDLSLFSNQLKQDMTNKLNQIEELENQIFQSDNSEELQIQFQQAYDEFEIFLDNLDDMSEKLDIQMIFLKDISKNLQTIKCKLDQLIKNVSEIGKDVRKLRGKNVYELLLLRKEKVLQQKEENELNQIYIDQRTQEYDPKTGQKVTLENDKYTPQITFLFKDDQNDYEGEMNEFLWDEKERYKDVLLLKGKAGSGKSRAARNIEEFLWKFDTQQPNWYPIYISLPSLNDPLHNLIDQGLESENYNFDKLQIREFKEAIQNENLKIVLILDSYDEMKNEFIQTNLITTNRLSQDLGLQESGQKIKVIITCREEILTSSTYQSWFYGKSIDSFKEVQLVPFNQEQSSRYLQLFIKMSIRRELLQFYEMIKQLKGSGFIFSEFRNICSQLDSLINEILQNSQNQDVLVQDQDAKKIIKKLKQIPQFQFVKDQQFLFLQKGLLSLWSEQKFIQIIQNLKINDFLRTPFMMEIIVQILPKISQNYQKSSTIRELVQNNYKKLKYQILQQKQVLQNYQQKDTIKIEVNFNQVIEKQLSEIMLELEGQQFFEKYQISSKVEVEDCLIIQQNVEYKLKFDAEVIYQALKINQFTTYDFYQMFINYYHQQQLQKWMQLGKINNQEMISIDLLEFSQSLALDMMVHQQFQVNYQPKGRLTLTSINQQNLKKQLQWEDQYFSELDSDSDYKQLIKKCILLSSKGSQHQFTHKSIQEYFVAKYIFNILENIYNNKLSDEQQIDTKQLENSLMNNDLFNMSHEHFQSALLLLKEKLQNKDDITKLLVSLVQLSKQKDSKFIRLASNSIFLLSFLGKNLGLQDFDSVCISETYINGLSFCESRLSKTYFNQVSIDSCNFNNAIITDAEWTNIITKERITKDYEGERFFEIVLSENGDEFYTLSQFNEHQIILRQFNFKLDQKPKERKFNLKFKDEIKSIQIAQNLSIMCCQTESSIQLWNLQDQNNNINNNDDCIILRDYKYLNRKVFLSQDGSQLLIKMDNIIIWFNELTNLKINNTQTNTESIIDLEKYESFKMAISLNLKLLVILTYKNIWLWDIQDYQNITKVQEIKFIKDTTKNSVAFSKNGNNIVITTKYFNTILEIENQRKINKICSFFNLNDEETVLISPDNNYITFYCKEYLAIYQTINIKQLQKRYRIPHKLENFQNVIAAISNNFKLFACTSKFTTHIWNIKELNQIQYLGVLESDEYEITILKFSNDCQYLISYAAQSHIFLIWDMKQMKLINKFTSEHYISSLIFSSDGQVLVSHSNYNIVFWDISNIQKPNIITKIETQCTINFLIVSKKQGHIIQYVNEKKFIIWNIQNYKVIQDFEKESSFAIFNDDGNKFATYHRGIVDIWKLQENIFVMEYSLEVLNKLLFFSSNNEDVQLLKNNHNYKILLQELLTQDHQFCQNQQLENEGFQLILTVENEYIEIQKIEGQSFYYIQKQTIIEAVFSSDSSILCFATEKKQIIIMNISKTEIISQINIDTSEICRIQLSEVDDILAVAHENKDQTRIDLYTIKDRENPCYLQSTECFGIPHTMLFMNNNQYLIIGVYYIIQRFDLDNFKQPKLVGFQNERNEFIQHLDGQHLILVKERQICFLTTYSILNISGINKFQYLDYVWCFFQIKTKKIQIFYIQGSNFYLKKINTITNQGYETIQQLNYNFSVHYILPRNTSDLWIFKVYEGKPQFIIFDSKQNAIINRIDDEIEDRGTLCNFSMSEDDQYLVSAYDDSNIKVWDMKTYKLLFKQKMNTDSLDRVLISSKGMLISCYMSKLKVWNFKALRQQQNFQFDGHSYAIKNILVSPDGLVLASVSKSGIKFWDLEELKFLNEFEVDDLSPFACKFNNDGTYFAFQNDLYKGVVVVFKFMSKYIIEKFILKSEMRRFEFYFTSDSQQIVEIVEESIIFWNLKEAEKFCKLSSYVSNQQPVIEFTFSNNCKYAIAHKKFQIYEVNSEMKLTEIKFKDYFESEVRKFCLSNRLNMVAIQFDQREIFLYSIMQMVIIKKIECNDEIIQFYFSLNDELLILLCRQEYLVFKVDNIPIIEIKRVEIASDDKFTNIFPFQENQFIFFQKQYIQIFQNLQLFNKLPVEKIETVHAFCTKDKLLAVAQNRKKTIHIYELKNPNEIKELSTLYNVKVIKSYAQHCNSAIQFSQNCQFLISLGKDKIIRIWDIKNTESIQLRFLKNNISVNAFKILQDHQIGLIGNDNSFYIEDYNSSILLAIFKEYPIVNQEQRFLMVSSEGTYSIYFIYSDFLTIFIYDQFRQLINQKTQINSEYLRSISFLDSQTLIWQDETQKYIWKFLINKEYQFNLQEDFQHLKYSQNQQVYLGVSGNRKILGIYNSQTDKLITEPQFFQCSITEGCFSPCGEKFIIALKDGSIQLFKFDSNNIDNCKPPICYKVFAKSSPFLANNCQINGSFFTSTENENLESLFLEKGAVNK
ncbi:unnamed protein product [Paramecium sonneborni]|uniref:NACHT domain-containing protein n=1 Tax=Paramecium sonneborni TaxID=65129 RepID=A0A8S1QVV8_9CILI|nr:unnamed protein product [Paramecium sonneborni]